MNGLFFLVLLQIVLASGAVEVTMDTRTPEIRRAENLARYLRKKAEREAASQNGFCEPQTMLALPGPSFPNVDFHPPPAGDEEQLAPSGERFHINGRFMICSGQNSVTSFNSNGSLQTHLSGPNRRNKLICTHRTNGGKCMGMFAHPG